MLLLYCTTLLAVFGHFTNGQFQHRGNSNQIESTGNDCSKFPSELMSFWRGRLTCCDQPKELHNNMVECVKSHRAIYSRREDLSETTTDDPPIYTPSIQDCYVRNSTVNRTHQFTHNADALRESTLDVMECSFSYDPAWKVPIKHAYDICNHQFQRSEMNNLFTRTRCGSFRLYMVSCVRDQLFVNCPKAYWNNELDSKCDLWRERVNDCPSANYLVKPRRRAITKY